MLSDGRSKVYNLSSTRWSLKFRIQRDGDGLAITYLDYGEWYAVPAKYKLAKEVEMLLKLVKHKRRAQYDLSTSSSGIVSIDRDRELLLMPPGRDAT
jgi:hypothetical protein